MKDLYEELGVPPRASAEMIRETYLAKARELHPDKGGDVEAMTRLSAVYKTLHDPSSRKTYDGALQVSDKFPKLCSVCDGTGQRKKGLSSWVPCAKCKATGRA